MQGKTHLTIGAAAGAAVAAPTGDITTVVLSAALGGLAGLIPDWLQINVPGASIKGAFGHRGFSHWAWAALIAAYAARITYPPAAWPVLAGWGSHILLDALSSGVPAFWPLGRVTLASIKTGGKLDTMIGATGLIAAAALIIAAAIRS